MTTTQANLTTNVTDNNYGHVALNPDWGLDPDDYGPGYIMYYENPEDAIEPWSASREFIPTVVVYSLAFIVGIIGNALVIFALTADRKTVRNEMNSFLISLATSDLLFLLVCIPYETGFKLSGYLAQGVVLCKMAGYVEIFSTAASILNLTFVSIERYIVIVYTFKARSYCTLAKTRMFITTTWVIAAMIAIPNCYYQDVRTSLFYNQHIYVRSQSCGDLNFDSNLERIRFVYFQLVVMFIIPILAMAFCYSQVIRVLWLSTKDLDNITGGSATRTKSSNDGESSKFLRPPPSAGARTLFKVKDKSAQTRDLKEGRKQVRSGQ